MKKSILLSCTLIWIGCDKACKDPLPTIKHASLPDTPLLFPIDSGSLGAESIEDSLKTGFANSQGQKQLNHNWDQADFFEGDLARARWGNQWGLINRDGTWILNPIYEHIGSLQMGIRKFLSNGKWGYLDSLGAILIPAQFDQANDFSENFAVVSLGGRSGFVNKKGQWVLNQALDQLGTLKEGLAPARLGPLWGYINTQGDWIIRTKWRNATEFSEGLAAVQRDSVWEYIDTKGQSQWQIHTEWGRTFHDGLAAVGSSQQCQYINRSGVRAPKVFTDCEDFQDGYAWAQDSSGLFGVLNNRLEWVIQPKFAAIERAPAGWFKVWTQSKGGLNWEYQHIDGRKGPSGYLRQRKARSATASLPMIQPTEPMPLAPNYAPPSPQIKLPPVVEFNDSPREPENNLGLPEIQEGHSPATSTESDGFY